MMSGAILFFWNQNSPDGEVGDWFLIGSDWKHTVVATYQSQGSHTLRHTPLGPSFYKTDIIMY